MPEDFPAAYAAIAENRPFGEIPFSRLDESVRRILTLKLQLPDDRSIPYPDRLRKAENLVGSAAPPPMARANPERRTAADGIAPGIKEYDTRQKIPTVYDQHTVGIFAIHGRGFSPGQRTDSSPIPTKECHKQS